MAQSLQTAEVFIKNTFGLPVAVRCTEDAEAISRKNGLSFVELLRPFSQPASQAQLRDVQSSRAYTVRNMRVRFSEPRSEPMPDAKMRLTLGQVVLECGYIDGESRVGQQSITGSGGTIFQYPTPWFDQYREVFLDNLKQLDYEYIRHYVGVMLVVSTRHPRPMEGFEELYKVQKESEKASYPKWLTPTTNLYYYHVLLHDATDGSPTPASDSLDCLRKHYGPAHCQLLVINSQPPGPSKGVVPDPWRQYIRMPPVQENEPEVGGAAPNVKFVVGGKKPSTMDSNVASLPREIVLKPSEVREEPMLIDLESDLAPTASSNTSSVELGSDPLTQVIGDPLAQQQKGGPTYSLVVQSGSGTLSSSSDSITSWSPVVDRIGGGGGGGIAQRAVGQCLSVADHNSLRAFVQEFLFARLVPHLDSVLRKMHEIYSNRRTTVQKFWHKIRKSTSMSSSNPSSGQGADDLNQDSAELQARLVGDLAFLLQNYERAHSSYNDAKGGLSPISVCYAGALEMHALSAFMMSSTKKDVVTYLEEAYSNYLNVVRSTSLALRTIMFLSEVMKERNMYRELTQLILVKTTSSEDDDVRNALFLEQVAHAFLRTRPPMIRKYAFHMVLASHRYYRAMQRIHSQRVLKHALDVYAMKGWSLAEDFICFSLARYSFSLHKMDDASAYFEQLLSHECSQSPQQQLTNLKEYIFVQKQRLNNMAVSQQVPLSMQSTTLASIEQMAHVPMLPSPQIRTPCISVTFATGVDHTYLSRMVKKYNFQSKGTRNILSEDLSTMEGGRGNSYSPIMPHRAVSSSVSEGDLRHFNIGMTTYSPQQSEISVTEREWHALEASASSQKEHSFRTTVHYMDNSTDNSYIPMSIMNEPVAVNLVFKNQLQVMLNMVRISLLWRFAEEMPSSGVGAATEVIDRLILDPGEERQVTLHITPLKEGTIEVVGVVYTLTVQDAQLPGDFPTASAPRTTLPSLTATAKDSIYERSAGLSVQSVLSEGIQGKLMFSVRGQRLNMSKVERCGTVYGPDYRLKWTVTEPQPKIVASLTGLSSWSLIGQVTRLTLEVINCGHAPMESLRLATSLSDHILLEADAQPNTPIYSYHPSSSGGCIQSALHGNLRTPSGMTIPLPDGCLHPGQKVTTTLLLHSPESVHDIPCNMMFCYRKLGASNGCPMRYRVLRHPCTIKVRDSLQVRAYAVHSYLPISDSSKQDDLNNLLIALEVENRCQVNAAIEIQVLQVSSVSDGWRIQKVDPNQSGPKLLPGMGGLIHLKATRISEVAPDPKRLWFNDIPFGSDTVNGTLFPTANFFYSSEAYRSLGVEGNATPTYDLALVVLWKACIPNGGDTVYSYGQHSIGVELPQSMASLSSVPVSLPGPLTPPAYDMVKYVLDHTPTVHHNFSLHAACRVPIQLIVQNCCKVKLEVAVQFGQPAKDSTNQSVPFFWSGNIASRRVVELEPNATKTISVFANFTVPGVFNLNLVQITAVVAGTADLFVQRRQRASYITVME